MSTGQPIPFFPHPPAQYNQGYFAQLTRAFAVYAEQMRASQLNNEFLTSSNNLSDLDDDAVARTNLGLVPTATPTDATAARLLKVGDSATLLSASPALRVTYGGTADAITLTTGAGISGTPPTGLSVRFRATAANTGATTVALDGGSAVACRTERGAVLPAGYIRAAGSGYSETIAIYDGTHWIVVPSEPIAPGGSGDVLLLAADSVSSSNNTYATQATSGVLNPGVWAFHVSYSALASTAGRARLIRTDTSGVLVEADSGLDNYSPAMAPMAYAVLDAPTTVELQTSRRANGGTTDLRGVRGTGYKIGGL